MEPSRSVDVQSGISRTFGACTVGFGLAALLGWIGGYPLLTSFGPDKIPMAPSTALLFLLFGTALLLAGGTAQKRKTQWTGAALGWFGTGCALLLLILSLLKIHSKAEHLGITIAGTVNGAVIGHMSPLTACCFVLAGAAFLALLSPSPDNVRPTNAAFLLALIVLLLNAVLTMAYLMGGPLLYGSGVIPPAQSTALAFLALGAALVAAAGSRYRPRDTQSDTSSVRTGYVLFLIFMLAAVSIVFAGYLSFRNYQKLFRLEVDRQLSSVADLKVSELVQWRKERLGDAEVFHNNDNFIGLVRRLFENPGDADLQSRIRMWLEKVRTAYRYDRVFLLDDRGVEMIAAPESVEEPDPHLTGDVAGVLRSGKIGFLDFHRDPAAGPIHLALLIPLFDESTERRPMGVLVLRIDPETYLYPLLRRWPTHSETAETLLVRRDGNEVLFLNELRFQQDAALNLKMPMAKMDLPAAMAIRGIEGVVDGTDYRGMQVVAATRAIPDSPWFLVARMDADEVYAPMRERLWSILGLIGALLLGTGAITGFLWRNQNARFYRERYEAAESLRESESRYRDLYENAPDMYFSVDSSTARIARCNQTLVEVTGYSKEELIGRPIFDMYHADSREVVHEVFQSFVSQGFLRDVELQLLRKDGCTIDVSLNSSAVRDEEGKIIYSRSIWRDITVRKQAERHVEHLNRVLRALRNVNQLIVREKDREQLIRSGCRLLVEYRSYECALIVLVDKHNKPAVYAHEGLEEHFPPMALLLERGELPPCCERARLTGQVIFLSDRPGVCAHCPMTKACAEMDTMCIGLTHGGRLFGYLMVAVERSAAPDGEEQDLFTEMAGDLAFALHGITAREAGEQAERERQSLEDQLLQSQKMEAVGRLAGGVAHDFNNMLAVIGGHTEMALEDIDPDSPLRDDLLEIQKAAWRSADLTRQLLAFSRKQTIAPRILDLNDTIAGLLKMLRRLIGEDIDLLWKPAANLWRVKMDPAQLDQILANLMVNARDAITAAGKITIETARTEFDEQYCENHVDFIPGRYVLLAVSDNGTGMDRETVERIFEPFFTTKPRGSGTGLGLSTVYGTVKQHNGFINVYSEPGTGSTFRIYLPAHEAESEAIGEKDAFEEIPTGTETILIVEDEESLLKLGKRLLEQLGYTVLEAGNPVLAIQTAQEYAGTIHLLVTDVVLPEMSGRDLWEKLAAERPDLKCLYMSGYTANVITHHGVLDEGVQFMPKPFSRDTLAKKVRKALEE